MKRTHRILSLIFVGLTIVCGIAAIFFLRAPRSAAPVGWRFAFPAGHEWVYDVAWHGQQSAQVTKDEGAQGSADLDAELTLRGYGQSEGAWRVGARLGGFRKHSLKVLGAEAIRDDAAAHEAFDGHEALVEIEPNGKVRAVYFQPGDPALFKHVMQWLVTQLQVTIADDKEWTAEEAGPFGLSTVKYVAGEELVRTRVAYTRLDAAPAARAHHTVEGATRIKLTQAGQLDSLVLDEKLTAQGALASLHLEAKLRATMQVEALTPPVAGAERREPGQLVVAADMNERLLDQRVDGLTIEEVLEDLSRFGEIGDSPELNKWVWRASGLLALHPELARELQVPYKTAGHNARGLILDVLAGAGNPECQSVMRKLLDDPKAREQGTAAYVEHLQRISQLGAPQKETVQFAWKSYTQAPNKDVKWASAYAVGSTVRHLADTDPALAKEIDRQLRDEARRARTTEEQAMLVRALGNAATADDLPVILDASTAEDAEVRRASASALRLADGDDAMQALLKLATDKEVAVQAAALASLDRHNLSSSDLSKLAQVVLAGGIDDVVEGLLVNLLSTRLDGGQPVVQMLQFVQEHTSDGRLRARIGLLLG
jgi:hypothetical protein